MSECIGRSIIRASDVLDNRLLDTTSHFEFGSTTSRMKSPTN